MIVSIQHKGLRLLWEKNDASKLPANQVPRIRMILDFLDAAEKVEEVNFSGSKLHPLKGTLKGLWSISVSGNYRMIFKFENGNVFLLNYLDYH